MARGKSRPSQAPDTFDEFESWGERALQWVADHGRIVLSSTAAALVLAGAWGFWSSASHQSEARASDALSEVREDYMAAMGASPGAIEVPELANPEAALAVRADFAERFREVAEANPGTAAAGFARLAQGDLLAENGAGAAALEAWRGALAAQPGSAPVRGLLQRRVGQALEAQGEMLAAAEAYEAAAAVPDFTFRPLALADAARCFLAAGERARAVALIDTLETEAPDLELPEYLIAEFREARAAEAR